MKRRDFFCNAGGGLVSLIAAGQGVHAEPDDQQQKAEAKPKPKGWKIELEIFEARPDSWCHKKGDRLAFPQDLGKICPWLRASLDPFIWVLSSGATLPWKYEGTPYEKVIDPAGVTTEYVRCPDPTANLVVKIIRTAIV